LVDSSGEERKGKAAGHGEICGGAGLGEAEEGEEERKGDGGETDRWGRLVSETKEKKGAGRVGCNGEEVDGLLGRQAGREEGKFSPFFFFSFSNYFETKLLNSNSNKNFSNFSTNFYNLFKSHTSNQKPCKAK
jgi:hypothetical protein